MKLKLQHRRPGRNGKLQAKLGSRKARLKDGVLYPRPQDGIIREAMRQRGDLERAAIRNYFDAVPPLFDRRIEETQMISILKGVPSVAKLAKDLRA